MGDYLYLPQQSEEHFIAHNRNNLDFIELNPLPSCLICFPLEEQSNRQFQDFWNWLLNEHSAETYTAYTTYYFDQAYFENNFEERNNNSSTQTVTPKPMTNDLMQANILAVLQAATANQYDEEYKFQIVGGYLQGSPATWFLQETDANAQHRIIRWTPINAREENTSFTTRFEAKFRTPILISKWHMELERRTQGPGEVVTEYAKAIRKLIKYVDSGRNWTEEQKIHSFTKGLRTDLSYALWSLLALKDNSTMDMAIKLAQRIEDNQRIHLESTFPVFAPASVMASASQMAAAFFAAQTQDPNEQLINKLTANFARLLEPLAQAVRDNQQPPRPRYEPRFN
ncbi:hypothetical protein G9A89_019482 [Geosiphon pyriformis]|nr:hypothetical protein G9A89_019482 [Geosiphon pyriformis]